MRYDTERIVDKVETFRPRKRKIAFERIAHRLRRCQTVGAVVQNIIFFSVDKEYGTTRFSFQNIGKNLIEIVERITKTQSVDKARQIARFALFENLAMESCVEHGTHELSADQQKNEDNRGNGYKQKKRILFYPRGQEHRRNTDKED